MRLNRRWLGLLGVPVVAGLLVASTATSSHAQDVIHTFPDVSCTAVVGGSILPQTQDVTIEVIAPDSVAPNSTFTLQFPGGTALLPTRMNSLSVTSYSNLFQTLQLNGADFGNIVNPGTATFVPSTATATAFSSLVTYAVDAYVYLNEGSATAPDYHYFRSLVASNRNNPPATSLAQWVEVPLSELQVWHSTVSYTNGAYTSEDGIVYRSLIAANLNHDPATTPVDWAPQPNPLTTPETVTNPLPNQMQFGNPGPVPAGGAGDPFTLSLTTPTVSIDATAPASGSITLNMVSLTSHMLLNNALAADVTCNVPADPILTIPVLADGETLPSTTTSPSTSTSTSTSPSTTTSTSTSSTTSTTAVSTSTSTSTTSTPTTTTIPPTTTTTTPGGNTIGHCSGVQFIAGLVPPLAGNGDATQTVATLKTVRADAVVWGVAFNFFQVASGSGSCTIGYGPGAFSANDMLFAAKLSGTASCNAPAPEPSLYPLNGKIRLSNKAKTDVLQGYMRVTGFDPVPGPDVIAVTGIVTKGNAPGATVNGEFGFDPVKRALVDHEAGGPELKGEYYFDNSQIGNPCGTATGGSIGLVYGGDGVSLLGSSASGLTFKL